MARRVHVPGTSILNTEYRVGLLSSSLRFQTLLIQSILARELIPHPCSGKRHPTTG